MAGDITKNLIVKITVDKSTVKTDIDEVKRLFESITGTGKAGAGAESQITAGTKAAIDTIKKEIANFNSWQITEQSKLKRQIDETKKTAPILAEAFKTTGISPTILKSYQMTDIEIKKLTKSYMQLNEAMQLSGIEKYTKAIKDVRSGVIVKGQGTELTETPGFRGAIGEMDVLLKKYPELKQHIGIVGQAFETQHSWFSKLVTTTKNYIKFQTGWFLGASVIFGFVGFITAAAKASLEFAQTLKNIQAITGVTNKEIDMLASTAKRISMKIPLAADKVAKLGLQLIRAGLNARDASAAMEIAAKVATVSGEDTKVVADTIATAMMAWKIGAEGVEKIGNTIAASLNYSRLTVQDLGTAFNYMAGVASSFNKSFEETNAILAVYSNLGVKASTIATGWVQLMSEFIAPSKKATEYLHQLGLSIEDVNPQGQKFSDILRKLEQAGFDASMALDIFQTRAGRALMFALRAGSAEFERMIGLIEKSTQLQQGLAKVMEGPIAEFKKFWNQIQGSAIEISVALIPAITTLTTILGIFGTVIYHNIHLLTTFPGRLVPIAGMLALIVLQIKQIIKLQFVTMLQDAYTGLILVGKALFIVIRDLTKFKELLTAIQLLMTKNILGLVVTIGTVLAGGWIMDKILGGESKIKDINKMRNELDETNNSMKKMAPQVNELGEEFDNATSIVKRFNEELDALTKPDISKALQAYSQYQGQISALRNEIEQLKNSFIDTKKEMEKEPDKKGWFWRLIDAWAKFAPMGKWIKEWHEGPAPKAVPKSSFEEEIGKGLTTKTLGELSPLLSSEYQATLDDMIKNQDKAYDILISNRTENTQKLFEIAGKEAEIAELSEKSTKKYLDGLLEAAKTQYQLSKEGASITEILDIAERNITQINKTITDETQRTIAISQIGLATVNALVRTFKTQDNMFKRWVSEREDERAKLEKIEQGKIQILQHTYEIEKMQQEAHFNRSKTLLDHEMALWDEYYQHNIVNTEEYYKKKMQFMDKNLELEIAKVKWNTERAIKLEMDKYILYGERYQQYLSDIKGIDKNISETTITKDKEELEDKRRNWERYGETIINIMNQTVDTTKKLTEEERIALETLKEGIKLERERLKLKEELEDYKPVKFGKGIIQSEELDMMRQRYQEAWNYITQDRETEQIMKAMQGMAEYEMGFDIYEKQIDELWKFYDKKIIAMQTQFDKEIELLRQRGATEEEIEQQKLLHIELMNEAHNKFQYEQESLLQQQKLSMTANYINLTAGIMQAYLNFSDKNAKAQFIIARSLAVAMAIVDAHRAAVAAAASVAGTPFIGTAMAAAAAAKMLALGYANAAIIAATAIGQAVSGKAPGFGGGGAGGGDVDGSSYPYYIEPKPKEEPEKEEVRPLIINTYIYGNVIDQDKFAREIVPSINKAIADGVR